MAGVDDWVGGEIAGGRYAVRDRIGSGSMGQVFRAWDHHLETEVVIKCPVPPGDDHPGLAFLRRFDLEVRSLVHLSHPHIVKILDVGSDAGLPFVVLQYLSGGTLRDRMDLAPARKPRAMPPASLHDWLMDVARALDFIHRQNYLHRDVKPENILFDRYGNAFLTDFGITKALAAQSRDRRLSSLTAPGFLMGTPNYVAPEVVMGGTADARVDQYALAMTVYEVVAGSNPMEGATPGATLVNQTNTTPAPLFGLSKEIPLRLSDAVLRGVSKRPEERFDSCVAFAQEALAEVTFPSPTKPVARSFLGMVSLGVPGRVPCPVCETDLPVAPALAGQGIKCQRCQATLRVETESARTLALHVVGQPAAAWSSPTRDGPAVRPSRRVVVASGAVVLLVIACLVGWGLWGRRPEGPGARMRLEGAAGPRPEPLRGGEPAQVSINIACSAEKRTWLDAALAEFARTPEGQPILIHLRGMGAAEGLRAIVEGPGSDASAPPPIHVWAPASSVYRTVLEHEWRKRRQTEAILHAENLVLSPLVFVMWKERQAAFVARYAKLDFRNVAEAMAEPQGWAGIAHRSEWGRFKFGHPDPTTSSSGLQMLVLLAGEFAAKPRGLTVADVTRSEFQAWLSGFELGVTRHGNALARTASELMEQMVLRGPSQYDCLLIYENLAITSMHAAPERWGQQGELAVAYPDPCVLNEHPYYILNVPWSNDRQRQAAAAFLKFLRSEPIQRRALEYGLRPTHQAVAIDTPASPLVRYAQSGFRIDLPRLTDQPRAEVVQALLDSFRAIAR